jgi:TolA-binding protein
LSEVKDQLGRIEDRRVDDVGRLEQKIENSHVKLENLLINILKKDSKRKEREEQRDRDKH